MSKRIISILTILVMVVGLIGVLQIEDTSNIVTALSETVINRPTCLSSLEVIEFDRYTGNLGDSCFFNLGDSEERNGNFGANGEIYRNGIDAWLARWNYESEISWVKNVYKLSSKYNLLTGHIGLIYDTKNNIGYNISNFDTTVYFYNGDKLLKSYRITNDDYKKDISVNVSNVDELTIFVKDNVAVCGGTSFAFYNMYFDNNESTGDIIDENEFIKEHLNFIGSTSNNTYNYLLDYCDLSEISLRDYGEMKDEYDMWRTIRGKILDNPYEITLADMIISESSAKGQIDSFELNLYSEQRTIINDFMKLIEGKTSVSKDEKNKIQNLFETKDFSDNKTYQLCQKIFGELITENELKTFFQTYDTSNKFMSLLGDGQKIVDSIIDLINYSSILQAYNNTSEEFKLVLIQMDQYCQIGNLGLDYAIMQYLTCEDNYDIRDKIVGKVAGNTIEVGIDLFEYSITKKVGNFLLDNMDLSGVSATVASNILSFIEGMKIGYDIGVAIDNILFNTDNVSDAYVNAYAAATTTHYCKLVLEGNASKLTSNQTIENAKLFCQSFNMFKHLQVDVANKMIRYFAANEQGLISKVFKNGEYEYLIYRWQVLKLNWTIVNCHDESTVATKTKNITIACPVNINIYDQYENSILQIKDDKILYSSEKVVATIRNNIKYITLPDSNYKIEITANDEGTMTYSIANYNFEINPIETVIYNDIKLQKGTIFDGNIIEGDELKEYDYALSTKDGKVDCNSLVFKENDKTNIESIILNIDKLNLTIGQTYILKATISPENASVKTVTWYSENPSITTVNEYGEINAKSIGETTIVCESIDGKVVQKCKINVSNNSSLNTKITTIKSLTTKFPKIVTKANTKSTAIKKAKIKNLNAKAKGKKITVSWKKIKIAKGYQVQAATNKKFKKKKIVFDKKTKNKKITIKGNKIKKNRIYYIRVRAYTTNKNADGKPKYTYSKWTKKKVKNYKYNTK